MVALKKLRKFPIKAQHHQKRESQFETGSGHMNLQWSDAAGVDENSAASNIRHEELHPPAIVTNKMIKTKRAGGVRSPNEEQDAEETGAMAKDEANENFADGAADRRNANMDEFIVYPYANKANLTKFDVYGYKQGDARRTASEVEADAKAHRMAFSNGFREYLNANNLLTTTETNETDDNDIDNDDDDDDGEDDDEDGDNDSDSDDEDDGVTDGNEENEMDAAEGDRRAVSLTAAFDQANFQSGALIEESLRGSVMLAATATVTASTMGPSLLVSSATTTIATTSTTALAAMAAAAAATATATAMPYLDNSLLAGASVVGVATYSVPPSSSADPNQESTLVTHNQTTAGDGVALGAASSYWNLTSVGGSDDTDVDFFYRHSLTMTVVYCVAYLIVFLVGLIGNSFVISVVLRAPRMRTVTNYFIMNLAIADILVIVFCLPATLMSNVFVPWMLGWLMCKTVPYIQGVSVAASVYSLIAVSLDRFIAIWWPLKQMTKSRARFMILCIWVIALGSTIPWLLFFDLVPVQLDDSYPQAPEMFLCQEVWPPGTNGNLYFLLAHLVACYLLPMSLITLCYVLIWVKVSTRSIPGDTKDAQMDRMQQKSKVKVIKMLVAVVILFVLSWLPLYVIFARIKFGGEMSLEESEILDKVTPFAQWLGSSNSCINPILYAFFNKKYRRAFAAIIQSRSCCGRLRYYDNVAIASSTTSTRKSSHYHTSSRKSPSSPGLRKTNAVSYIYEHNSLRRSHHNHHSVMLKQDSNLSQQMLLKQDSHGSRQFLIKQESATSEGSRRLLCQQNSNGSKLSKQDSVVSYMDQREANRDEPNTSNRAILEYKRQKFVKQDSVVSCVDQRPEPRRHQLVKQDSVISFADQRGKLNKQDSMIGHNTNTGHHVSILKKTDSQHSNNGFPSPRRNVEIYE